MVFDEKQHDSARGLAVHCGKLGAKIGFWTIVVIMVLVLIYLTAMVIAAAVRNQISVAEVLKRVEGQVTIAEAIGGGVAGIAMMTLLCAVTGGVLGALFGLLGRRKLPSEEDD